MRAKSALGNFVVLDSLRGVVALLVLVDHAGCILLGRDLVPRNALAVQFFFMLSGFVLACGYATRMQMGMRASEFLIGRAIRLYPLIVFGAFCSAGALLIVDPAFAADPQAMLSMLASILCLPVPGAGFGFGMFPVNPPEWSLFFEIGANVCFALLLPMIGRRLPVVAACGASLTYAALTMAYWPGSMPFWCEGFGAMGAFGTGIVAWRLHEGSSLSRWATSPRASLVVTSIVLTGLCMAPMTLGPILTPLATLALFPAVILAAAASGRCRGNPSLLGQLSYPLYILHWPVLLLAREWVMPAIGANLSIPVACATSCCLAWAAYRLFDVPVRAFLQRMARRLARASASGDKAVLTLAKMSA